MGKSSDDNSIALVSVLATVAGTLAGLAALVRIRGNPLAEAALVVVAIAVGILATVYAVSVAKRWKSHRSPSQHLPVNNRSGLDNESGYLAEGEQTGRVPSRGHRDQRVPAHAGQPGQEVRPVTTGGTGPWVRPDIDPSLPLIEERLELRLAGGGLRSQRVTQGEPRDVARVALPSWEMVENYRQALGKAVGNGERSEGAVAQARRLSASLQEMLLQAVPESVCRRLAAAGAGAARQLAAIELKFLDRQLERYPWELIADPEALQASTAGITVWRSVPPPLRPVYRGWTGNLLLTGTASPLRLAPPLDDELTWIKSDLNGCSDLEVCLRPGIPASFGSLMAEYRPAAFHLVTQETGPGPPPWTGGGPALTRADALPELIARGLKDVGTWLAVFSCHDSATVPAGGGRPPGYQIADASGAAVIGMAGPVPPYSGGLFATALYRCLAAGFSVMHAYHEAVCRVRCHDPRSTMWSVPVMYAETSNVVPFPVSDEARTRLSLVYFRRHAEALDHELEALAQGNIQSPGEWARRTATPSVRTTCITKYLAAAIADQADPPGGGLSQKVAEAQHELGKALGETRKTLDRLGSTLDTARRRQVLQELYVHRRRHQVILQRLDELIGEVG
jgi:hypothetical protein